MHFVVPPDRRPHFLHIFKSLKFFTVVIIMEICDFTLASCDLCINKNQLELVGKIGIILSVVSYNKNK